MLSNEEIAPILASVEDCLDLKVGRRFGESRDLYQLSQG
jgi:hypothetical protein